MILQFLEEAIGCILSCASNPLLPQTVFAEKLKIFHIFIAKKLFERLQCHR